MVLRNHSELPSEMLEAGRHVPAYVLWFSPEVEGELEEQGSLRSYLGRQLRDFLGELGIQVACKEIRPSGLSKFFSKDYKLVHLVEEFGSVRLQFTDLIREVCGQPKRSLESVAVYQPGDWESKLQLAYQKCLDINEQLRQVDLMEQQLCTLMSGSEDPVQIIELIEKTSDTVQTLVLLALSPNHAAICEPLLWYYLAAGHIKGALTVTETLVDVYPNNAQYQLALGNLYLVALASSHRLAGPSSFDRLRRLLGDTKAGVEIIQMLERKKSALYERPNEGSEGRTSVHAELLKQVNLESLECSTEYAFETARKHFISALRCASDGKLREQVVDALASLDMARWMISQKENE